MSMHAQFVQISAQQLSRLIEDPSEVEALFMSSSASTVRPETMKRFADLLETKRKEFIERGPQMFEATLARLDPRLREQMRERLTRLGVDAGKLAKGAGGEALFNLMKQRAGLSRSRSTGGRTPSSGLTALSIDKSWHGIHYLLCGAAEPTTTLISQAVIGGAELGDDFSGYGPARYFNANETTAISSELSRKDLEAEMLARFDPAKMTQAEIYPNGWAASDAPWLMEEFRKMRDFYADAAAKGAAILTCLV